MSETLALIMKHWTGKLPPENEFGLGVIDLPFNIENFCRENDEKFAVLYADQAAFGKSVARVKPDGGVEKIDPQEFDRDRP